MINQIIHNQNFLILLLIIHTINTDINAHIDINNQTGKTQLNLFNSLSIFSGLIHIKLLHGLPIKLSHNNRNIPIGMILNHIE